MVPQNPLLVVIQAVVNIIFFVSLLIAVAIILGELLYS